MALIDKVHHPLAWMRKALRITEKTEMPDTVLTTIRPVIDSYGAERLIVPETQIRTNPGTTSAVNTDQVPDDEMWYIYACFIDHTDTGGARDVHIAMADRNLVEIPVQQTFSTAANTVRALNRPLYLPPGGFMFGRSRNAIVTPFNFRIGIWFARLQPGEYVYPS